MEEKLIEEYILKSFKYYMGEDIKEIDIIISIPANWGDNDEYCCKAKEFKLHGRVWEVICNRNCKVIDVNLITPYYI